MSNHGLLHHLEFYVDDLTTTRSFYDWLLPQLGYQLYQQWDHGFSYRLGDTYLVFVQVETPYRHPHYHRKHSGVNHLAFHVESFTFLEHLRDAMKKKGTPLLYDNQFPHAGGPQHVALYAEDPNRMKLEFVAPMI